MNINQLEKDKVNIGARVNRHLVNLLKEAQIPISNVVESSICYFLTLEDVEKREFLMKFKPDNLMIEQIKFPKHLWTELQELDNSKED